MKRRTALRRICGAIAASLGVLSAAVVAVPGVRFSLAALRRRKTVAGIVRRVVRLVDLPLGVPVQAAVTGRRRDAWTLYPEQTLGRVWLVRRTDEPENPKGTEIDVFTTVCPHMGCNIQLDPAGKAFFCPCHKARFDFRGRRIGGQPGKEHPSPRNMDSLSHEIVNDREDESGRWWVQVTYESFEVGLPEKKPRI